MSIHVLSWVFKFSDATLASRLVLLVIADHAKDDGTKAWPDVDTMALEARVDRRTVQRCLRDLEESGAITKTGTSRSGTSIWTVHMTGDRLSPSEPVTGAASDDLTGGEMPPEPSLDQPSEDQELAPAAQARPRDLIWDELERRFGAVAEKTNAHAKRNKAVIDLKRQDATVDTIRTALRVWPQIFPGATVTDTALSTHFVQLVAHGSASRKVDQPVAEVVNLPELDEEQIEVNLARVRELRAGIGQ